MEKLENFIVQLNEIEESDDNDNDDNFSDQCDLNLKLANYLFNKSSWSLLKSLYKEEIEVIYLYKYKLSFIYLLNLKRIK
jgi:hypothetical protein